jgi:lysophospholipase L1-like esterase
MKNSSESLSILKKIVFALILLIILLIILEVSLRIVYFQAKSQSPLALITSFRHVKNKVLAAKAKRYVQNYQVPRDALFSAAAKELLEQFQQEYETNFKMLVEEAQKIESKLVVLYIPTGQYENPENRLICRNFFAHLAEKYQLEFIDLSEEFRKYPLDVLTLLPDDGHLSRFGNQVVANKLAEYVDKYSDYRTTFQFEKRAILFGDLKPNDSSIWQIRPDMPYRVTTNTQGLRMDYDLTFPKKKQRILVLGDSVTFGPYLPSHHTYPYLLERKYSDKEVINAGVAGYTITDELSLFVERARYVEPDITVLEVLDNDISDLFFFKRNEFDRKKRFHQPSELEKKFLEQFNKK